MLTKGIINLAIAEAEKSTYRFKIGAVIFKGKRIISSGHNGIRSSANIKNKFKNYINSLHAEQAALMNIDWCKVKGCSIFVAKVSHRHGLISMASPCDMCRSILSHVGINTIYYADSNGQIVREEI